ncbi:MAG: amidase [Acidimicrobiales bacterium]|nr:amidase [Acidimicrobiales bacterium]
MADTPWTGDACSLVEAFRAGERSPAEELEATYGAIDASATNSVCFTDREQAMAAAAGADVSLPFGGVPIAVKELDRVAGWPARRGSVAFKDDIAEVTDTKIARLAQAGGVLAAQTTSSEFGGVNQTFTKLHGATRNPWNLERTPGGSSGGSAAGVAEGLFTLGTGGDGGGSIRIPGGFCGLVGLKSTWGRIPHGPGQALGNLTAVPGCMSRSVRDTARWFDVSNGFDRHDPLSLPRVEGWEAELGTHVDVLSGRRTAVIPEFAGAVVADETIELVLEAAEWLIAAAGLSRVDVDFKVPKGGAMWGASGGVGLFNTVMDRWPDCADDLTGLMRSGVENAINGYDATAAVRSERARVEVNEGMANLFAATDFVMTATNPDVAFEADGRLPSEFGGKPASPINNGALTIPSNIYGNPAISVPIGFSHDGLPVGLQILAPHHQEQLLLDLALLVERERPWPLVAPVS